MRSDGNGAKDGPVRIPAKGAEIGARLNRQSLPLGAD